MQSHYTQRASRRHILGGVTAIILAVVGSGIAKAGKGGIKGGNGMSNKGGNGKSNRSGNGKGKQKGKTKVTLCHNPGTPQQQTIVVGTPASREHLAHGDVAGPCQPAP